jgi:uncharacterized membrane protein YsdA (DUF1294 family)
MIEIHFTLTYLQIYLIFITFVSFALFAYDKFLALQNNRNISRISEFRLLVSSFLGGTIGSILSMILFRHKIKKPSFLMKFALVMFIQIGVAYLYFTKLSLLS